MNQYRYKCPTKGCEIDTILVNVHEDVIEYFGFCCPFCQDHMVRDDTHQSERDTVLDVGGILESLCKTDLYWYNKGVTEGEDVGKCRGKDCNYCGRYNEKLRQAGE